MLLRLVKWLAILILLLLAVGLFRAWQSGAWNLMFPSHSHDERPPQLPSNLGEPAVLVFSKTNSFRHVEAIATGQFALSEIALDQGWDYYLTENGAVFNPEQLARFAAVVFLNASGDMLSEAQERAFQTWLESGGGWVGIHGAGDDSHREWRWYTETLIGAGFIGHIMGPQFQRATVVTENHDHPVNAGMPNVWEHEEEWYSFDRSPRARGFNILAVVDEDSYTPEMNMFGRHRDLRMGDHPVAWSNCVGEGRAVYTALGHQGSTYDEPQMRHFLRNSIAWVMGLRDGGCEQSKVD